MEAAELRVCHPLGLQVQCPPARTPVSAWELLHHHWYNLWLFIDLSVRPHTTTTIITRRRASRDSSLNSLHTPISVQFLHNTTALPCCNGQSYLKFRKNDELIHHFFLSKYIPKYFLNTFIYINISQRNLFVCKYINIYIYKIYSNIFKLKKFQKKFVIPDMA